jgi:heme ABC exporter ATP-binding subunit CcmA
MAEYAHAVVTLGLTKRFGYSYAVRDLSLSVPCGSVLLVVGPNGAGKTTLLRILGTALRPSAGHVSIFGRDLVRDTEAIRGLSAYLGTAHGMYEALTAQENLAFAAAMSGRPVAIGDSLDRVGLGHIAHQPVRTFSQGMKRRLALARLALITPRLLLLDEPFTGLDADGTVLIETLVAEVKARDGSVVLATHEWERGLQFADTIIALADGRQVAVSSVMGASPPTLRALSGKRA